MTRAKIVVVLLAVAAATCGAPAPTVRMGTKQAAPPTSVHLALGTPRDADPTDDVMLDHGVFVASYDPGKRVPNWVAWRLVAEDTGGVERKGRTFHADHGLPAGMPGPRDHDYARSGFDRGHMCPFADRDATEAAADETFVLTNAQPQRHALNGGPWEQLERFERDVAQDRNKQVFLVAGGLFDAAPEHLPAGEAIPRANYKILVVLDRNQGPADVSDETLVCAVIMPNSIAATHVPWPDYLVSIDEIERASGYDFLALVPEAAQARVEARVDRVRCRAR